MSLKDKLLIAAYNGDRDSWVCEYHKNAYKGNDSPNEYKRVMAGKVCAYYDRDLDSDDIFVLYLGDLRWMFQPRDCNSAFFKSPDRKSKWSYREPTDKEYETYMLNRITYDGVLNNE